VKYIFYENARYFSLLFGENGLDNGGHFRDPALLRFNALKVLTEKQPACRQVQGVLRWQRPDLRRRIQGDQGSFLRTQERLYDFFLDKPHPSK